jgi:hypothetical protein
LAIRGHTLVLHLLVLAVLAALLRMPAVLLALQAVA